MRSPRAGRAVRAWGHLLAFPGEEQNPGQVVVSSSIFSPLRTSYENGVDILSCLTLLFAGGWGAEAELFRMEDLGQASGEPAPATGAHVTNPTPPLSREEINAALPFDAELVEEVMSRL